jgi:hypothetical protein
MATGSIAGVISDERKKSWRFPTVFTNAKNNYFFALKKIKTA